MGALKELKEVQFFIEGQLDRLGEKILLLELGGAPKALSEAIGAYIAYIGVYNKIAKMIGGAEYVGLDQQVLDILDEGIMRYKYKNR